MQKISIRAIKTSDTDNIILWRNNSFVKKNFIFQEQMTVEIHQNWMKNFINTGKVQQFIISDLENKIDVGSVYLRDIDHCHHKAEFGIFIGDTNSTGKGYGTQATKLILDYAFKDLHLNKVFLRVFSHNFGAIKSYKKAGFVEEGLFKQDVCIDNKFYDLLYMAVLRETWERK